MKLVSLEGRLERCASLFSKEAINRWVVAKPHGLGLTADAFRYFLDVVNTIVLKIPWLPKTSPQWLPELIDPAVLKLSMRPFQKDLSLVKNVAMENVFCQVTIF